MGRDRGRPEGEGPGAARLQDRPDRLQGPGRALPARSGAGDLAAGPRGSRGARARPLSPPPGEAPLDAEVSDPLDPDQLRPALPGHRSLRPRGQGAIGSARGPRALARQRQRLACPDRRSRGSDRGRQPSPAGEPCRAPLHPAAFERPGNRLGARLHDRRRDRRDLPLLIAQKLTGYSGLCPRVVQSGESDRRGPLSKHGPTYLRWALVEATMHALRHPAYAERYQRTKRRLGKQRGAKVAQIEIARRLAHAIWHMLTRNQSFAPRGAAFRLAA